MVRRLVGYDRLSGLNAAAPRWGGFCPETAARFYVNFFQLLLQTGRASSAKGRRAGAQALSSAPLTPCQRLLASSAVDEVVKQQLRQQFAALDPVALLKTRSGTRSRSWRRCRTATPNHQRGQAK